MQTLSATATRSRVESIDLLRGLAIVLMAIDHVRDYFHSETFIHSPTDLEQTNGALFFTRFLTHFCAPVFCFLAGTSAFFVGQKKDIGSLSIWLFKRGLWLVIAEFTIINFGWYFRLNTNFLDLSVIWSLGVSMIALSGIIHLPKTIGILVAVLFVSAHNLFDWYRPVPDDFFSVLWTILHVESPIDLGSFTLYNIYPVMPWIGLMALGYIFGVLYTPTTQLAKRKRRLLITGVVLIVVFLVFRLTNFYGDPHPWKNQGTTFFTFLSFLNVSKYPPSFLFLCVTLGPAMIFLAFAERVPQRISAPFVVFGRVPMFFYIVHIYLVHLAAMGAEALQGRDPSRFILTTWVESNRDLAGLGFDLWVTYAVWAGVVLLMYPICRWYNDYKTANRQKEWLSYL